jgi:hypothetical protein
MDFDTRAVLLGIEINDAWDEKTKEMHHHNKETIRQGLLEEFGLVDGEKKIQEFITLGSAPFSIIAFHNDFLRQIRHSFVIGSYYPALTGACALGERILNHLILKLRDSYKGTSEYKDIHRKDSFDNWDVPINALHHWGILLPAVVETFRELKDIRHRSLHFNPDTDHNAREYALDAISKLAAIVNQQFSAAGTQPWFIPGALGASFIKRSSEHDPFIRTVYLPNCLEVGPLHTMEYLDGKWLVHDQHPYQNHEVTDEEYIRMFNAHSLTP